VTRLWGRTVHRLDHGTWSIDNSPPLRLLPAIDALMSVSGFGTVESFGYNAGNYGGPLSCHITC
jgi:hypothetical protein